MGTLIPAVAGPAQRLAAEAARHLVAWLDHHTGGRTPGAPVPARLTYAGAASRNRPSPPCPACGRPFQPEDDLVEVHGDAYHAACALYQPRRRAGGSA